MRQVEGIHLKPVAGLSRPWLSGMPEQISHKRQDDRISGSAGQSFAAVRSPLGKQGYNLALGSGSTRGEAIRQMDDDRRFIIMQGLHQGEPGLPGNVRIGMSSRNGAGTVPASAGSVEAMRTGPAPLPGNDTRPAESADKVRQGDWPILNTVIGFLGTLESTARKLEYGEIALHASRLRAGAQALLNALDIYSKAYGDDRTSVDFMQALPQQGLAAARDLLGFSEYLATMLRYDGVARMTARLKAGAEMLLKTLDTYAEKYGDGNLMAAFLANLPRRGLSDLKDLLGHAQTLAASLRYDGIAERAGWLKSGMESFLATLDSYTERYGVKRSDVPLAA